MIIYGKEMNLSLFQDFIFLKNEALWYGGGLYIDNFLSDKKNEKLIGFIFKENIAQMLGGGLYWKCASYDQINPKYVLLEKMVFEKNIVLGGSGGGFQLLNSECMQQCFVQIQNSDFEENTSQEDKSIKEELEILGGGGAISVWSQTKTIKVYIEKSIFKRNRAQGKNYKGGALLLNDILNSEITSCFFENNLAD